MFYLLSRLIRFGFVLFLHYLLIRFLWKAPIWIKEKQLSLTDRLNRWNVENTMKIKKFDLKKAQKITKDFRKFISNNTNKIIIGTNVFYTIITMRIVFKTTHAISIPFIPILGAIPVNYLYMFYMLFIAFKQNKDTLNNKRTKGYFKSTSLKRV